ncbi:MAG: hypothetical protein CL920_06635 [Deltaproteobacteria bacterium]|nr:hypothetical protein [Deltaproteobacteria bacterium]MBU48358.1 hypothetical protein [Deltaproteobacteria bacterium]|tara:strand:+ start:25622 stop:26530 length:909 start_codon:yes stop_codon:yes gene_type:complete
MAIATIHCGNNLDQQKRPYTCGPGYEYTASQGCVKTELFCDPACLTDEICKVVDGKPKCELRVEEGNKQPIECTIACQEGEICDNGKCISLPCKETCKDGFICSRGQCVLREECIPPCPQFGYVCDEGVCQKICVPACGDGERCNEGICEKICNPDCGTGFFCREGTCVKLEDSDGDKYPADRDCNDKDKTIYPGAPEVCDQKDNDCDGRVDNIEQNPCYSGSSGSLGNGSCKAGVTSCDSDGKEFCKGEVAPTTETCNGQDDDCDGVIDNCPGGGTCTNGKCPVQPEPTPEKTTADGGTTD